MELMELDPVIAASLYKPLNTGEIRLARLEPGVDLTPITINLISVNTRSSPAYDALSYVWGDVTEVVPICCNGLSTNVTPNLHWALSKVRLPGSARLVWADALCINQGNVRERSEQLALMGQIYSKASEVLACFGEASDGRAKDVASLLSDYGPLLARPTGTLDLLQLWRLGATPDKDQRWQALRAVMAAPWFRRAWVLQEVGLARRPRVIYGAVEFSYRDLMITVRWITAHAQDFAIQVGISAFLVHTQWLDWSDRWAESPAHSHYRLVDLMDHGALLQCKDPRDRIFAFLSHPLAKRTSGIVANYAKSRLEIYEEATALVLRDAGVRALSSVEHIASTLADSFPSWVIRWDVTCTMNNIYTHPSTKFYADGRVSGKFEIKGKVLYLRGIVVDTIDTVFDIGLLDQSLGVIFQHKLTNTYHTISDIVRLCSGLRSPYSNQMSPSHRIAHTLCCELEGSGSASLLDQWESYCENMVSPQFHHKQVRIHNFWVRLSGVCRGRALVLTSRGLYGLAPAVVVPGDLCCVVYGSAVPFILRPSQTNTGREAIRLLGEAYIHGMMNGEAVLLRDQGRLKEQVFAIV